MMVLLSLSGRSLEHVQPSNPNDVLWPISQIWFHLADAIAVPDQGRSYRCARRSGAMFWRKPLRQILAQMPFCPFAPKFGRNLEINQISQG
jgi:hypothetical protein